MKSSTLFITCGLSANLYGLGIEYGYHDPEIVARGNSGVASASGASAVYYNPALLANPTQASFLLSGYALEYEFDYSGPNGSDSIDGQPAVAASAFAMIPLKEGSGLGIGLYSPFGQKNEWNEDSPLRNLALDTKLLFFAGTLGYGFEVTPNLSIGLSASVTYSDASLNRGLVAAGDRFSLEGDGEGWGLGAGFSWDPVERHRIAGSVRWWSSIDYDADLLTRSPLGTSVVPASTELDFPTEWTLGYAWMPCDEWVVGLDVIYTEWSSFDQLAVQTREGSIIDPLLWNDSFKVALGATRYWDSGWWLGFGYWFAETTGPDTTFNPRLPDLELHVFSLGVGYKGETWSTEFVYQYGHGRSREIKDAPAQPPSGVSANGKYSYLGHGFSIGLTRTF